MCITPIFWLHSIWLHLTLQKGPWTQETLLISKQPSTASDFQNWWPSQIYQLTQSACHVDHLGASKWVNKESTNKTQVIKGQRYLKGINAVPTEIARNSRCRYYHIIGWTLRGQISINNLIEKSNTSSNHLTTVDVWDWHNYPANHCRWESAS